MMNIKAYIHLYSEDAPIEYILDEKSLEILQQSTLESQFNFIQVDCEFINKSDIKRIKLAEVE